MSEFNNPGTMIWAALVCIGVVAWGIVAAWRWFQRRRLRKQLVAAITATGTDHLADVLVPDGMGAFYHIDFLLLTPSGLVVIDLRDVKGNVFGGDQMTEWTVMDSPQRSTFPNPQNSLYDRIAAVKAVAGDIPVEGRIVFTSRAKFPKGLPTWTVMIDSLRTEFPSSDLGAPAGGVPTGFAEAWARVKTSVLPSPLNA